MARSPSADHTRVSPLALLLLLASLAAGAAAETNAPAELTFSRHSQPVATRSLAWLEHAVPHAELRVHEPYEAAEATFLALPLERVLDAVYSPSWRDEEELLFSCRDGYQPAVPVARVLAHHAWLAFDRVGPGGFAIDKRESGTTKRVELGPFYLVWENLTDAQIRQEADYGWPYQVVGIDLIRRRDRFPKLSPPAGSSAQVQAGFEAFRIHCSKCHKLNGEGGSIGPELDQAMGATDARDPQFLRHWIDDPSRILPTARMPALNPALPNRERTIDEIVAYLRAMAAAQSAPAGH